MIAKSAVSVDQPIDTLEFRLVWPLVKIHDSCSTEANQSLRRGPPSRQGFVTQGRGRVHLGAGTDQKLKQAISAVTGSPLSLLVCFFVRRCAGQ